MADPISILGLILQVVHTTKRVYEFARQVKDADSEIRQLFGGAVRAEGYSRADASRP